MHFLVPLEDVLSAGTACALLVRLLTVTKLRMTSGHLLDLVLCGHSFGSAVAHSLAQHLACCGVGIRGIVALEDRWPARLSLCGDALPAQLVQSQPPRPFRLQESQLNCIVPLVPRIEQTGGKMEAWGFPLTAEQAPDWSRCVRCKACHLPDANHWDVPISHQWDVAN